MRQPVLLHQRIDAGPGLARRACAHWPGSEYETCDPRTETMPVACRCPKIRESSSSDSCFWNSAPIELVKVASSPRRSLTARAFAFSVGDDRR